MKNMVVRQTTDGNIIRRMTFTCLINKAVETHSGICNNYCFSTARMVTQTLLKVTLYVYLLCKDNFRVSQKFSC